MASNQEAMDGSPAMVVQYLETLSASGKFAPYTVPDALKGAAPVIAIKFQCGPLKEAGVNGCAIEDVIDVLIERLEGFQHGTFHCTENVQALIKLQEAKHWLLHRTSKRQKQGVEGTNQPHVS